MSRRKVGGQWVDEGPSRARVAGYVAKSSTGGFALIGGAYIEGESTRERDLRLQREAMKRRRAAA